MNLPKIDYHSHILPGIDDGVENAEKSILLIKQAKKYGVEEIYATPHCYLHKTSVENFCAKRQQALESIENIGLEVPVKLGNESLITEHYFIAAEQLKKRFGIVMAHPNRYSDFIVGQMLEIGAVLQINSDDVCRKKERKRIIKWID